MRPAFGVARPMQGGGPAPRAELDPLGGGGQFPPIDPQALGAMPGEAGGGAMLQPDAMQRLTDRQNASGDAGSSKVEGFEASVHKIK
ncbi:MAG: CpaF family protein, partial [Sphingomonas sp.]